MARRTTFKLSGVRTYVDNIKNEVSQEAAREIVLDLKRAGPYWTGDFEEAWVVKLGDTRINATKQGVPLRPKTPYARPGTPSPVVVPKPTGRKSINYTIGNEMVYRNVAMDLVPGRLKGGPGTAEQDWFRKYVEGGPLRSTLARVINRTASKPSIRGFKK